MYPLEKITLYVLISHSSSLCRDRLDNNGHSKKVHASFELTENFGLILYVH